MLSMALLDEPLSRYSVSIQSMNQWLLIRFQGVTMLFLFVVTSSLALWGLCAPARQRRHLLWWRKSEKWGDRNWGMGIIEKDRQGFFFSFLVMLRSVSLLCVDMKAYIGVLICRFLAAYNICSHVKINPWLSITYQLMILLEHRFGSFHLCLVTSVPKSISLNYCSCPFSLFVTKNRKKALTFWNINYTGKYHTLNISQSTS